jgi:hypothetical protein
VHSTYSRSRSRKSRLFPRPPRKLRLTLLGGVIAFGASLPLTAGALATYGEGAGAVAQDPSAPASDVARLEPGEDRPGGAATSRGSTSTANAFSLSSGNLNFKRELDFKIGNAIFRKVWVSAPSSTDASDGLGPLFNARLPELPSEGRPRPSALLFRCRRRFGRDAGPPLGSTRKR